MPEHETKLEELVERIRQGDEDAARELIESYGSLLRYIIQRKLSQKVRALLDSQDIEQFVWRSFFTRLIHDRRLDTPEGLLRSLKIVARDKTVEKNRHFARQKNDRGRVQSLDQLNSADKELLVDRRPAPEGTAIAREEWDRLLEGQPEHCRRILELLRDGHTHLEVAARLGLHPKTVQRVVGLARLRSAGKLGTAGA
jgi:DNA-directed RNA polymerase specialized sigma24 family protein